MKNSHILCSSILIIILNISHGNSETVSKEKYKVVIIGAGISGLGAATHLLKNNLTDILILEASNRLGGRVYTAPFGDYVIEYGAQFVHGQGGNLVYEIAEPFNFFRIQNLGADRMNLKKIPGSKINIQRAQKLYWDVSGLIEDTESSIVCNTSIGDCFNKRFAKFRVDNNIDNYTAEALSDVTLKVIQTNLASNDVNGASLASILNYGKTNGSSTIGWKSGYRSFIDILLGKLDGNELPVLEKTKFNKVVQTVDWSGNEVRLTCEDGSQYYADHVITTVSLGVLKHSAKTMFTPSLPERKLSAIQTLGYDVLGKIFIQFSQRWWPLLFNYDVNFLWTEEDKQRFKNESKYGAWTTEITDFHYVINQPRVLLGWTAGETTRKVEQMTDKELIGAVVELFQWFLGDEFKISEPVNVTKTTWASNRFFRGAYSYDTLDSDKLGHPRMDLAQPLLHNETNPVLLFAGEATHESFYGCVHGALETGIREAKRILSI